MKRKVVNPDPNHKKRIQIDEKLENKDTKDLLEDTEELKKEIKFKVNPHKS